MSTAYLIEWSRIRRQQYVTLVRELNWYGKLLSENAVFIDGPRGGKLIVLDIWDSREAFERFARSLFTRAILKAGLARPVIRSWEVHGAPAVTVEEWLEPQAERKTGQPRAGRSRLELFQYCPN